jgi:hypothetical protein
MVVCVEEREENPHCFYCDGFVPKGWGGRERDHFPVPREAGGVSTVVSCYSCHHMKDRIRFYEWPLEWVGRVFADLPKFGGEIFAFLAKAAQAIMRAQHKNDAELAAIAEQCGVRLHEWPIDWQARVIADFPNLSRETRIFLAKVMALANAAGVKMVAPPLPPLRRMTFSTAAVAGTFGVVGDKATNHSCQGLACSVARAR